MTDSQRRTVLKAAGSLAVVGSLAGCAQDNEDDVIGDEQEAIQAQNETQEGQDQQLGAFRVVHAAPDAPNVDVRFDQEEAFTDVGYGGATSYAQVQPGTYQVEVAATGDPETVIYEQEITVDAGQVTTAVVFGQVAGGPEAGVQVQLLEDEITDPGEEMARLRLFHAVPDAPPISVLVAEGPEAADGGNATQNETDNATQNQTDNVTQNQTTQGQLAGGQPLIESLAFGEYQTVTVPAGDYTFDIVPASQGQPMGAENETAQNETQNETAQGQEPVSTFEASLESGAVYSAFAIGYLNPEEADSDAEFEVLVLQDAMDGERADGGSEEGGLSGVFN